MKIIIHWIVSALAIIISAYLLPGIHVSGVVTALILAVVLGLINAILRPILVFLTLPLTIVTLGLFILVINAGLVELTTLIVPGFTVSSFWSALFFAVVLSIVGSILHAFDKKD